MAKNNRGIRVFNSLFPEPAAVNEEDRSQGRSDELIRKRNERLCARLYFYKKELPLYSYEAVKDMLQEEFEISTVTIAKIIQEDEWGRYLQQLKNTDPDTKYFTKRWWWMNWSVDKIRAVSLK